MRHLLAILPLLSPLAHGQMNKAEATLHARTVDDRVEAAIEIDIDSGWHLYHENLGDDPNAVGKPTKIRFLIDGESTDEVTWTALAWPEPKVGIQVGLGAGGTDAQILEHKGSIVIYAVGSPADAIDLDALTVSLSGLTCQDDGVCVPYKEEIEVDGEGSDSIWEDLPEELASGDAPDDGSYSGNTRGKLFVRHTDHETRAVVVFDVDLDWHIYDPDIGTGNGIGVPMNLTLEGRNLTWGLQHWPKAHILQQPGLGPKDKETGEFTDAWIRSHEGRVIVRTSALIAEDSTPGEVTAKAVGQACQSDGMCVPVELALVDSGKGEDEWFEDFPPYVAADTAASDASASGGGEEQGGLWQFLGLAFVAGFITLLMPCTYPMIPITISFFTKQADARDGKVLPLALTYGAGIVLIFVLIGVVFAVPIRGFAAHWATNLIIGSVFVYFAFTLFGAIDLQPPQFMLKLASKAAMTGGYLGVFLMGATLVITSFTCTAPFVGSLLSAGATGGDNLRVALGMAVFGATMALPFVYLSLVPGKLKSMPKSGEWMSTLKVTLGFVELGAALKFFSNADLSLNWQVFPDHVFLPIWISIFAAAGLYLLGLFSKGAKIGGMRRLFGTAFLGLCGYWGLAMAGVVPFDFITIAMKPPYGNYTEGEKHEVIKDDYPAALASAASQDKLLLVNFTGFV